jgi:hypothetical protein
MMGVGIAFFGVLAASDVFFGVSGAVATMVWRFVASMLPQGLEDGLKDGLGVGFHTLEYGTWGRVNRRRRGNGGEFFGRDERAPTTGCAAEVPISG